MKFRTYLNYISQKKLICRCGYRMYLESDKPRGQEDYIEYSGEFKGGQKLHYLPWITKSVELDDSTKSVTKTSLMKQ